MTEHTLMRTGEGFIIEAEVTPWMRVIWTLTVDNAFDLVVKCHTVGRDGIINDDGLAVLFEDAESVRLEAL